MTNTTGAAEDWSEVLASKWAIRILIVLRGRILRFGMLHRELGSVSQKSLSASLKLLERNGLIERRHYPVIPPHVEYEPSTLGTRLTTLLIKVDELAAQKRELRPVGSDSEKALTRLDGSTI